MTYSSSGNRGTSTPITSTNFNLPAADSGAELLRTGSSAYSLASEAVTKYQRSDVTDQIIRYHQLYGGSDNTQQSGLAASKSLNYAKAPTMQQAEAVLARVITFTFDFTGVVGLFGAENAYVRVNIDVQGTTDDSEYAEIGWTSADLIYGVEPPNVAIDYYYGAEIYYELDQSIVNTYEPAEITYGVPDLPNPKVSIDINNIGTGNIYIDNWLDVMLYTREGEMWPYDRMFLNPKDHFYVGFHARNTRRLPFNVQCIIGKEYINADQIREKEYITN